MKNIHILPTDKPSRLHLKSDGFYLTKEENSFIPYSYPQNIYITSDEEKPKAGEWSLYQNKIHKCIEDIIGDEFKKIILITDQDLIKDGVQAIDDEFLEWFVKNPSCERVEIIEEEVFVGFIDGNGKKPIYDDEYKIIIPKEEPKQETLEEAANTYFETLPEPYNEYLSNPKNGFIAGAKWQQEQDERTCNHNYILTSEQGHRVIKCSKCKDTQPI